MYLTWCARKQYRSFFISRVGVAVCGVCFKNDSADTWHARSPSSLNWHELLNCAALLKNKPDQVTCTLVESRSSQFSNHCNCTFSILQKTNPKFGCFMVGFLNGGSRTFVQLSQISSLSPVDNNMPVLWCSKPPTLILKASLWLNRPSYLMEEFIFVYSITSVSDRRNVEAYYCLKNRCGPLLQNWFFLAAKINFCRRVDEPLLTKG